MAETLPAAPRPADVASVAAGLFGATVFVALATTVARGVSPWLDEVVVLYGIELPPLEILRYLREPGPLAGYVPRDLLTPLTYWLYWGWGQIVDFSELHLRVLGIVCVTIAVLVLAALGRRVGGQTGALIAALSFATSPNVITYAVGVRYYPFLLLCSACTFYCLVAWFEAPARRGKWAVWLTVCLIVAIQVHMLAMVMAGAVWSAMLLVERGRPSRSTLTCIAATLVASLSLVPFCLTALSEKGGDVAKDPIWYLMARLLYRSVGHVAVATSSAAVAMLLGGVLLVLATAVVRRAAIAPAAALLGFTMGAAMLALTAVLAIVGVPLVVEPRYSIWMLPGVATLLAAVAAPSGGRYRQAGMLGCLLMIGANGYGSAVLAADPSLFWTGGYGPLRAMLDCAGAPVDAVIHDDDPATAFASVPIVYARGKSFPQYLYRAEEADAVRRLPHLDRAVAVDRIRGNCIAVLLSRLLRWDEVRQVWVGTKANLPLPSFAERLQASGNWELRHDGTAWSLVASRVLVFQRRNLRDPSQ